MLQSGSPSKCNVFCVAKVWCESIYFRYAFATLLFEFQLYRPNAPAEIDFDNLLTPTLKSDTHRHEKRLFAFQGIKQQKPLTSFYPERFRKWCSGNTPYPLVNACMKQLNATGFMSNRGRQIVASCLVNELAVDWRYGAAYFEQQLLDYDVASNWGNWQYLAGVGADPRGKRYFDLNKQTRQYDPDGLFINKWQGGIQNLPLDSVDAADWPIVAG